MPASPAGCGSCRPDRPRPARPHRICGAQRRGEPACSAKCWTARQGLVIEGPPGDRRTTRRSAGWAAKGHQHRLVAAGHLAQAAAAERSRPAASIRHACALSMAASSTSSGSPSIEKSKRLHRASAPAPGRPAPAAGPGRGSAAPAPRTRSQATPRNTPSATICSRISGSGARANVSGRQIMQDAQLEFGVGRLPDRGRGQPGPPAGLGASAARDDLPASTAAPNEAAMRAAWAALATTSRARCRWGADVIGRFPQHLAGGTTLQPPRRQGQAAGRGAHRPLRPRLRVSPSSAATAGNPAATPHQPHRQMAQENRGRPAGPLLRRCAWLMQRSSTRPARRQNTRRPSRPPATAAPR